MYTMRQKLNFKLVDKKMSKLAVADLKFINLNVHSNPTFPLWELLTGTGSTAVISHKSHLFSNYHTLFFLREL